MTDHTDRPNPTLARAMFEAHEDWIKRFHRERALPEPDDAEIAELIRLGKEDERTSHQ